MLPVLPLKRRGAERHLLLGLAKPHCQPGSGGISILATGKAGGRHQGASVASQEGLLPALHAGGARRGPAPPPEAFADANAFRSLRRRASL